jgi:hypothetical protein
MRRIKSYKNEDNKNPVITLVSAQGLSGKAFKIFRKEVEKAYSKSFHNIISNYEINIQNIEINMQNFIRYGQMISVKMR